MKGSGCSWLPTIDTSALTYFGSWELRDARAAATAWLAPLPSDLVEKEVADLAIVDWLLFIM